MPDKQHRPSDRHDSELFERRYNEWNARVYRYLVHLLGAGPAADDLFQETWLKAIEHSGQLRDDQRFGPWILRIARNLAFNQSRQRHRRAQVWILTNLIAEQDEGTELDPIARQTDERPGPREDAIQTERRRILAEALDGVEPDVQEMLQLRYFEGLTLAEVAAVMEEPLGTVCTKVYRALRQVRQRMESRGYIGLKGI